MKNFINKIMSSPDIADNYKYYWQYQYRLGKEYIVPYSIKAGCFKPGDRVMEIGSAEGGVLHAFVEEDAKGTTATDISQERLNMGKKIAQIIDIGVEYANHNIITEDVPETWIEEFNLVILRDVIEHLDNTFTALTKIKGTIKHGGYLFVTFPPYYSPFGGHQHTAGNISGKIPWIHILPDFIFHKMISKGRKEDINEIKRLQRIRLTSSKFEESAEKAGYEIYKKEFYLLRPVFKMKFGLNPVKITKFASILPIRNFLCLEALYVLKKN
jgi:cyclopropane fatty-acyl-phospholipid synthase-like methyltransferase